MNTQWCFEYYPLMQRISLNKYQPAVLKRNTSAMLCFVGSNGWPMILWNQLWASSSHIQISCGSSSVQTVHLASSGTQPEFMAMTAITNISCWSGCLSKDCHAQKARRMIYAKQGLSSPLHSCRNPQFRHGATDSSVRWSQHSRHCLPCYPFRLGLVMV